MKLTVIKELLNFIRHSFVHTAHINCLLNRSSFQYNILRHILYKLSWALGTHVYSVRAERRSPITANQTRRRKHIFKNDNNKITWLQDL